MRYKKFIIENYKGVTNPIEVSIEKNSLIPIIGINECGKTTILNAIYAFDSINDDENETFKHLSDISNLYKDSTEPCTLSAIIEVTKEALRWKFKKSIRVGESEMEALLKQFPEKKSFDIRITRTLNWNNKGMQSKYELRPTIRFKSKKHENVLCEELILGLPYILYFDDFRETFPDEIEISRDDSKNKKWLEILEQLFKKTNDNYSIYELEDLEERRRKSVLSHVKKKLNETLTAQWANFKLENKESLEIDIDFKRETKMEKIEVGDDQISGLIQKRTIENEVERYYLKLDIIERDSKGDEHFFYVRDRSKGFYWFFNFVMKLEFNPHIAGDHDNAIYLLDEPGSYLHPYAQSKLCQKLRDLSENNIVIYCTHSHYLLNPDVIPLNKIHIASKESNGDIRLESFYQVKQSNKSIKTAFQTIYDALYIKPFDIDINNKKILIVEGIYDYYAFSLFKGDGDFGILPGKGAESLINFISLMIAYEVDFRVLWDNDSEGNSGLEKAKRYFGDDLATRHFFLLPTMNNKKRILQDLFDNTDMEMIAKELNMDSKISFEKKISSLYFSKQKNKIQNKFSENTKKNFSEVISAIKLIQ